MDGGEDFFSKIMCKKLGDDTLECIRAFKELIRDEKTSIDNVIESIAKKYNKKPEEIAQFLDEAYDECPVCKLEAEQEKNQ